MSRLTTAVVCSLLVAPLAAFADAKKGDAEKGKTLYKTYCVTCHGEKGAGDGPGAAALNPKPASFADAARMAAVSDEVLIKTVAEGGAAVGKSPMMVPWKGALNAQQIQDVVAYVRTLAPAKADAAPAAPAKKAATKK